MSSIRIAVLGGFDLSVSGRTVEVPGRKTRALLAYLAAVPGLHHRDKLAALLWGDMGNREARHNLRQALSSLRKTVPGLVLEGDAVGLSGDGLEVDATTFARLAREAAPDALEAAAALYRGPLLEGFDAGEGVAFEEWRALERERLHELAVDALAALLAVRMRDGPLEAGIQVAQRLLALEPHQESAHRALMRLYARAGRRGTALRQYETCAELLRRELGAEVEPETRRLYLELLQTVPTPVSADTPAPPESATAFRRDGVLVGREAEMAALRDHREAAWRGRPRIVTLHGEAGIGKSRLAAEVAADAVEARGLVLYGRAYETESVLPFWPWVDALRAGAMTAVVATAELHPHWRSELARLFPELGAVDAPPAPSGHVRLFEAFSHVVAQLAAERPVLLVLEDLQWADEMSLRLLAFVARRIQDRRVLVLTTVREEESPPLLEQALAELDAQGLRTGLRLGALSRSHTLALARALGGADVVVGDAEAERVWSASGGNPFVAVEMVRALLEGGGAQPSPPGLLVPERVQQAMARRLDRLSERARRLVTVSAVMGGAFEFAVLHRAANLTPQEAAEGVEELVARRILRVVDERLDFTHDLVRQVVAARLIPTTQQALHAAAGAALEAVWAGRLEAVSDRLAAHFTRADDVPRAVQYLALFAEHAVRAYGHGDAVRALDEAIARTGRLPAPAADRDRRRLELVLQQALSLSILGRFDDVLARLDAERPRLERLADPVLAGAFFFRLALTLSYLGDLPRSVVEAHHALQEAERSGDAPTAGRTHYLLALNAYFTGDAAVGVEHTRRAVDLLAGRARETHWLGLTLATRALLHLVLGEFANALAATAEAAAVARKDEDRRVLVFALSARGWTLATQGDGAAGVAACREAVELAPDPVSSAVAKGRLGVACLEHGVPAEAIQPLEEATALLAQFKFRVVLERFSAALGEAYLGVGRLEQARALLGGGLAAVREKGYAGWAVRALGRLAHAEGDLVAAERHLHDGLQVFAEIGARFEVARTQLDLAEVARRRGDLVAAARHAAEADETFRALDLASHARRTAALARPFGEPITPLRPSGIG